MTLYVDDSRQVLNQIRVSYLVADTEAQLHDMADRLEVARGWFRPDGAEIQAGPHYRIPDSHREQAIKLGVVPVTLKHLGAMTKRREVTGELGSPDDALSWLEAFRANPQSTHQPVERPDMQKPYVLTIEKDVPIPGEDTIYKGHEKTLKQMLPGESFFIPGADVTHLGGLLAYADSIEVPLTAVYVLQDEIYLTAGVRVWRAQVMSSVEAVAQSMSHVTYKSARLAAQQTDRYWHDPENGCVILTEAGYDPAGETLVEIDEITYEQLKAQYGAPDNMRFHGPEGEAWFKLKSGRCVEARNEADFKKYSETAGATRIALSDYKQWQAKQEEEL